MITAPEHLHAEDVADDASLHDVPQRHEIAVPMVVVVDRQYYALLPCRLNHRCRFLHRQAHRLLHDDMFARLQALQRQRGMSVVRRDDDGEVKVFLR
jgi:glucan phosphoethanolaminetransferase (alkaline phosphatase superfamily)